MEELYMIPLQILLGKEPGSWELQIPRDWILAWDSRNDTLIFEHISQTSWEGQHLCTHLVTWETVYTLEGAEVWAEEAARANCILLTPLCPSVASDLMLPTWESPSLLLWHPEVALESGPSLPALPARLKNKGICLQCLKGEIP